MTDANRMQQRLQGLLPLLEKGSLLFNEPMARHTTFRIGGPAAALAVPATEQEAAACMAFCTKEEIPLLLLGNGSNLLVGDRGFFGLVLQTTDAFNEVIAQGNTLYAGGGAQLSTAALAAAKSGLSGMEELYGIPGTVGGAVVMNAGAYGKEVKDVLSCSRSIDAGGLIREYTPQQHEFAYRHSVFQQEERLITWVVFHLKYDKEEPVRARMEELMDRRRSKQPLELPSAGSVFRRPEGYFAGALIEQCGLKGVRVGGAMVSEKHAGFIVNAGGATAEDVRRLIEQIQNTVLLQTGVTLQTEVKLVGAF